MTTVGKALDLFAMHLKVENINHTTTDLAKVSTDLWERVPSIDALGV